MEIRKILFPVDLTGFSAKVVPQVLYLAKKFDAELHLLFVAGSLEQYSTFFVPHPSLDVLEVENAQRAERKLAEFVDEHFSEYPKVMTAVKRGNPVEEIRKYAESAEIDLVVMASHSKHGLERALFGSVADQVLRGGFVPVMCINPSSEAGKWRPRQAHAGVKASREPAPVSR